MRRLSALLLLSVPVLLGEKCFEDPVAPPEVVPGAPTIGTAVAGEGTADISFTAPTESGTQPITGYIASCTANGATLTGTAAASPIVVAGLTNGTQYSCTVIAGSNAGASDPSAAVLVTPFTIPGAPSIGTITPTNGGASVGFVVPSSNGGSAITGYTATCTPTAGGSGVAGTGTTSPVAVTSLTNGTQYGCAVIATNARGNSSPSASGNVTPASAPGAPTVTDIVAGNAQMTITFDAPASNGGSAITTYAATCTASGQTTRAANNQTSPITVTQMTNGVQYTCDVRAANAVGVSPPSTAYQVTPVGAPPAPTIGNATPGNASASVAFTAPATNGGSAITGYTATCVVTTAGGHPQRTGTGSSSPVVVSSMVNGVAYNCSVQATNALGTSAASSAASVTPRTVPDAPTGVVATHGNTQATISFTAPSSNGGATITGYTVTCTASGQTTRTGTGTASPIVVTTMTNGVAYACSIVATNVAGNSNAVSVNVTPSNAGLGTSTLCGYFWNQVNTAITNSGGTSYTSNVSYSCSATLRTMTMNQIPDHPAAAQAASGNPNKMGPQTTPSSVAFTLSPALTGSVTPKSQLVGWAINGVKFDPATAEICPTQSYCGSGGATYGSGTTWNVEALGQTLFSAGVDGSNAHIQPPAGGGTVGGAYHYHGMPDLYLTYLNKGQKLTLIGFAVDGFPIYAKWGYTVANDSTTAVIEMESSWKLKTTIPTGRPDTSIVKYGTFTQDWEYVAASGHLDECNGRANSVTSEFPNGTYAYYITNTYPYIQRCLKGTVPP